MESVKNLLSDKDFDQLTSGHVKFIQKFLGEVRTPSYIPELVVFDVDGSVNIIRLIMNEDRYETVKRAGAKCYQMRLNPVAVIMVFEAWIRETEHNQPISSRPISSYADKQEIISVAGLTADGRRNGAMLWFNRRKKDNSIVLRKDKIIIASCDETKNGMRIEGDLLPQFFRGYAEQFLMEGN